jgi:hypothetical protein
VLEHAAELRFAFVRALLNNNKSVRGANLVSPVLIGKNTTAGEFHVLT